MAISYVVMNDVVVSGHLDDEDHGERGPGRHPDQDDHEQLQSNLLLGLKDSSAVSGQFYKNYGIVVTTSYWAV